MRGREVLPRFCYIFEPELRKLCARHCNRLLHIDAFLCYCKKATRGVIIVPTCKFLWCRHCKTAKYTIPASRIFNVENVDFPETRWKNTVEKSECENIKYCKYVVITITYINKMTKLRLIFKNIPHRKSAPRIYDAKRGGAELCNSEYVKSTRSATRIDQAAFRVLCIFYFQCFFFLVTKPFSNESMS